MKRPIQTGDLCEIVNALGRQKSPNIGLIVTVMAFQGEHSQHGRIWRCYSPDIAHYDDMGALIKTGWADLAQSWLKRIEPPKLPDKVETNQLEKTQ